MKSKGVKIKYIYIAVGALLAVFLIYQCFQAFYKPVETIMAVQTSVYDSVNTKGVVIRDEDVILSNAAGTTVSAVSDGERVAKNSVIANVFSSEEQADNYLSLAKLNDRIDYYENLLISGSSNARELSLVDSEISASVYDYVEEVQGGWIENMSDKSEKLTQNITNRQILTGENVDAKSALADLYGKRQSLKNSISGYSSIKADAAGYYVGFSDGLEDIVDPQSISGLSVSNVQSMLQADMSKQNAQAVGKIISGFKWYVACIADNSKISALSESDTVSAVIENTALGELKMRVESINPDAASSGKSVVILSCDDINDEVCKLRKVEVEIRFNSYEGIKVPNSAIRSTSIEKDSDGNECIVKCIYTLSAQEIKKKKVEVIYEGRDYVIASAKSTKSGYVRLYDNIVVKGRDLYDGKIIK